MSWFHDSVIAKTCLAIVVIIMIGLIVDAISCDNRNKTELRDNVNLWDIPDFDQYQQDRINKMIDNYFRRRSLNKSSYKKIIKSAREGIFRGAIGGCITNGPAGMIPGAIVYGVMSAVSTGMKRRVPMDDRNLMMIQKF